MKNIIATITKRIADIKTCQFVCFDYLSKSQNELARRTLILGSNYNSLVKRSLIELGLLITENENLWSELTMRAAAEVKASLELTLASHEKGEQNPDYTKRGQYIPIVNGLNVNSNDNTIQLFGLAHAKVVLEQGIVKRVNSAPLTIEKRKVRKLLPVGRFREFALDESQIHRVAIDNHVLHLGR